MFTIDTRIFILVGLGAAYLYRAMASMRIIIGGGALSRQAPTLLLLLILSWTSSGCAGQTLAQPPIITAPPIPAQPTATPATLPTNPPVPTPTQAPATATPASVVPVQPAGSTPTVAALGFEYWESLPLPDDVFEIITKQTGQETLLIATSFSDLPSILALYRRELPSQGWQEKPDAGLMSDTQAQLLFEAPEGSLKVELYQAPTGLTDIKLTRIMAEGVSIPTPVGEIPEDAEMAYFKGITELAAGLTEDAITDLDEAIALYPGYALAYHARGKGHNLNNNLDQAIADYNQALALDQTLILAYLDRGQAYAKQGELEKARTDYQQVLALNPDPDIKAEAETLLEQLETVRIEAGDTPTPEQLPDLPTPQATPILIQGTPQDIQAGQPFTIATAQAAHLVEGRFILFFQTILEDSRCPSRVSCAWAGQARILVGIQPQGQAAKLVEMNTNPPLRLDAFVYAGYEIRLLGLDPYPEEIDQQIPMESYQATFVISKK
jgi:tetratricopeptide (TPR) repeat protein